MAKVRLAGEWNGYGKWWPFQTMTASEKTVTVEIVLKPRSPG